MKEADKSKVLTKLISGEALKSIASKQVTSREDVADDIINDKYNNGEVRLITEQARYPLSTILEMVKNPKYILNPEFQRRHRWNNHKKSKLIESFIMNVPIPPIFLYEKEFSVYEVMDGLQRLTAIKELYNNDLTLEGLVEWPELNGRKYSTLPEKIKAGIDRRYLSSIIILQETAKNDDEAERLKQLVFERINSGGERLTPQEARNAIYNGPLNRLCIRLARNKSFCELWNIPKPTLGEIQKNKIPKALISNKLFKKMEDVEIVLRFFAYRQIQSWNGSIESFFDDYLQHGNGFSKEILSGLEELFIDTIEFTYNTFGISAFWLYRKRQSRRTNTENWEYFERPAKTLYDSVMYAMTLLLPHRQEIEAKSAEINASMPDFYKDNYTQFAGRSTNKADVVERMNAMYFHIKSFL
jgi:hypothetical protein